MCGILSGIIYRTDLFRLNELIPPQFLTDFCTKFIYPFVHTPLVMNQRNQDEQIQPQIQVQTNQRQQQQGQTQIIQRQDLNVNRNLFTPRQEYVQVLTDMGFDRNTVIQALQRSNNNLERATELLISE